jgi:primosomal protein N' (replication factor Y)
LALTTRFPEARVLRLDHDTTTRKSAHAEILQRFGRGEAEILLGTQMVAKGLHFPGVTLVGVVNADAGLHFPDLRAHERAFQLLTQVAGRSGRTGPGRVILQSYDPQHRVLQRVLEHDVEGFLAEELEQRRLLGYPPFRRLSAVLVSAEDEGVLEGTLEQLGRELRRLLGGSGLEILGPARAALPRIKRRFRGQLLLKGGLSEAGKESLLGLMERLQSQGPGRAKLDLALDVDPLQLL